MELLLPESVENETAILGSMLIDSRVFKNCPMDIDDFYLEKHKKIYSVFKVLFSKDGDFDIISVSKELERKNELKEIGGKTYLCHICGQEDFHHKLHEKKIKEASITRKRITLSERLSNFLFKGDEINANKTQHELNETGKIVSTISDKICDIHSIMDELDKKGGYKERYKTGISMVDNSIGGGFKDGDVVIIGGQTGHGKTTLSQHITVNASRSGIPCLWFSYEVLIPELFNKFKAMGKQGEIFNVFLPENNFSGSVSWITQKIKEAKEKYFVKMVVIDHLGFLAPEIALEQSKNYSSYLGQICREIKMLAVREEVVIIMPVHLRKTDNPNINDIRDSSGIAQEADTVILINREENDDPQWNNRFTGDIQIKIEKNRTTGETPSGWFYFDGSYKQIFDKKAKMKKFASKY